MQFSAATVPVTPPANAPVARSRMSAVNAVRGRIKSPLRVLLYGPEKIGKSTFASGAPGAWFLGKDAGTEHLDITRFPRPEAWKDVLDGVAEAERLVKSGDLKTLVLDPINWFEPLVHADITGSLDIPINFKQYDAALVKMRGLQNAVERVWAAGANVVIVAHSRVKKFDDPEGPGYERYEIDMNNKAAGIWKQWVDAILFARRDAFGKVGEDKKAKAIGSDAVFVHSQWSPAFDAGNRYGLPREMPLSWATFADAVAHGTVEVDAIRARIEAGIAAIKALDPAVGEDVEKKARGFLADPRIDVAEIENRIGAKLGAMRAQMEQKDSKAGEGK